MTFLRFLADLRAEDVKVGLLEVTQWGDRVLLGLRGESPDGETIDGYSIVSFRDGLVIRMQAMGTRAAAMEALG